MIRVLLFSPEPSRLGGVARYLDTLTSHLTNEIRADRFQIGLREGYRGRLIRILVPLFDSVHLVQVLNRRVYDVVHLNPSLNTRSLLRDGFFLFILTSVFRFERTIVFFHGWSKNTERLINGSYLGRRLFRAIFGRASMILVLATQFKIALTRMGFDQSKIDVVTTMFEGANWAGLTEKSSQSVKTVLFLSRFIKEKGIFELLEAFEKIRVRRLQMRLVLAGDGPERKAAEQWVRRRDLERYVTFTGYLHGCDKARILNDSDIFVLPSCEEGCPVALLEAMAAGLAIVVTQTGGIPDIITDGANGILLRTNDPEEIATALQKLNDDQELCEHIQSQNRRRAWELYEADVVTRKIEAVYGKVMLQR